MQLRQLVEVNVAALAVLAALLLGMGRESLVPPLAVLAAAVASFWLVHGSCFALGPRAVNLAVFAIAAAMIGRIARPGATGEVFAVADALVCLQIVLFFERRTFRTWWDLITLSLLQVLVAALQPQGPLFALVAGAYLFFGLAAMSLVHLCRERVRQEMAGHEAAGHPAPPLPAIADGGKTNWRRLGKIALATLVVGPLSLFLRYRESDDHASGAPTRSGSDTGFVAFGPAKARGSRDGSCAAAPGAAEATGGQLPSQPAPVLAGGGTATSNRSEAGREFWGAMAGMSLASLVASAAVFVAFPRVGRVDLMFPRFGPVHWNDSQASPRRTVGFSDSVALGELGSIIENPEEVLRVRFFNHRTDERYPIQGEVYLRGAVLNWYEGGQWEHRSAAHGDRPSASEAAAAPRFRPVAPAGGPVDGELVRQEITIKPMDREELFCVWPFVRIQDDNRLAFDPSKERLRRPYGDRERDFWFELGTTAFVEGTQADLVPCQSAVDAETLRRWPSDALPGLARVAERWLAESNLAAGDTIRRARLLERKLAESGLFEYSLQAPQRDPAVDPIEDFVLNHPQGHCEYFATALALMLRSRGIPARLVVGYKCGEYSYLAQAYRVRQSHAHAWVEAYIAPGELSSELRQTSRFRDWSHGGWLRLDPTPASSRRVAVVGMVAQEVESWLQWIRSAWGTAVLGMNKSRQRELIYGPVSAWIRQTLRDLADRAWWRSALESIRRSLVGLPGRLTGDRSFARFLGRFAVIGTCALLLAWACLRLLARRIGRGTGASPRAATRARRAGIAFYRRFEAALARHGLVRSASQTPREFARQAGLRMAASTGQGQFVDLSMQVVEAFYRVRFGGFDLDRAQATAVDRALRQFEQARNGRR